MKPPEACDIVMFGASGDLAHRKLLPSLYYLLRDGHLTTDSRVLAVARHSWAQEEYLARAEGSLREHVPQEDMEEDPFKTFMQRIFYVSMSATDAETYGPLQNLLVEAQDRPRVFYLAMPPKLCGPISSAMAAVGLVTPKSRVVVEKPIGSDLESAVEINDSVGLVFEEDQIYRIDHYLGKETVRNLMVLRFGNSLFEWHSERIDHVQITVAETLGMEGRGGYYDHFGALRDMVQNHLLQLLCLVAMEQPSDLGQDAIREERIKVLRALRPIVGDDVARNTVRGQYRPGAIDGRAVAGYREEPDIPEASRTETFVALKAEIDNWRWAGVPFYLRTGKRMAARVAEIIIQFKSVSPALFVRETGPIGDNHLVIRLQPDELIKVGFMIKAPGPDIELQPVYLNLDMWDMSERRMPMAYGRLLLDVIRGNATFFLHRDEVEKSWQWIDPIHDAWGELGRPRAYVAGTWGPAESIALIVRDERSWYENLL